MRTGKIISAVLATIVKAAVANVPTDAATSLVRSNEVFTVTWADDGTLASLVLNDDTAKMNWIEGTGRWGSVRWMRWGLDPDKGPHRGHPRLDDSVSFAFEGMRHDGDSVISTYTSAPLRVIVKRRLLDDVLEESYVISNTASYPVYFGRGGLEILTTFNDSYSDAAECLVRRCNAHIWCGGENSWVRAMKMGPYPVELALVLQKGSLDSYSVRRILRGQGSNDRGDFALHPDPFVLRGGEAITIAWTLSACRTGEFDSELLRRGGVKIDFKNETIFPGESFEIDVTSADGMTRHYSRKPEKGTGVYDFEFDAGGKKARAHGYCSPAFDDLVRSRVDFIVSKQQCLDEKSPLYGAYLIYDYEEKRQFFDYAFHDFNACRERVAMALTLARWLRRHDDPRVRASLDLFERFALREFFDEETCMVYDTIGKDPRHKRLYNAPNLVRFWRECYALKKEPKYLRFIEKGLLDYYRLGGDRFYPNGCDFATELVLLEKEGCDVGALRAALARHVNNIIRNGLEYPAHEVRFEQTIATAPVSILSRYATLVDRIPGILEALKEQVDVLSRFQGNQPDHKLHETAIRHWDGYWFGKRQLFGDTLHQHSAIMARAFMQYAAVTGEKPWRERAERCLRNTLYLFRPDGSATCAYLLPFSVTMLEPDGSLFTPRRRGEYADPFVNDMDSALYIGMCSGVFGVYGGETDDGLVGPRVVQSCPGYNSWPMIQAVGNRLVCAYSRGSAHTVGEGRRGVFARVSEDFGATWSDEVCVCNTPEWGEVTVGKGLDAAGAMLLWIRRVDKRGWGDGTFHDLWRTADGISWEKIASPELDPHPIQITDVFSIPGDRLMSLWFAGSYDKGNGHAWGTLTSADGGRTWVQKTIEEGLEKSEWPTELSAVHLGGGRILGIARCESGGNCQFQLTSTDGGETWNRERTNIRDVKESTPSLIYDAKTKTVFNYYYQRGAKKLRCRRANADFVFDHPMEWPESDIFFEGREKRVHDAGNVNATALCDRHFLSIYTGTKTDTTVLVVEGGQ